MNKTDQLQQLEEQLLDPAIRRNPAQVSALLTDAFLEFGGSGRVFDKASILEEMKNEELKNEPPRPASLLTDFAIRELSPTVILATYRATRRNQAGEPIGQSLRSSIWTHVNGQWQLTFHQGTPIPAPSNREPSPQK